MHYSVIYTVECERDHSIRRWLPTQRHLWRTTEGDECYVRYGDEKGKHRLLVAMLNQKQFDRFVAETGLYAEDVETLGSLGPPGFGFVAPAISFTSENAYDYDHSLYQNAYVTPIPASRPRKNGWGERDWERIRKAIIRRYGY